MNRKLLAVSFAVVAAAIAAAGVLPSADVSAEDAAGGSFEIDPVHSSAVFRIEHLGVTYFYGNFDVVEGSFALGDAPSVSIEIPIESLDTRNGQRDTHLKSADFFHAGEFPKMTFTSTKIAKDGDTWNVTGKLSLRGVTKEVTVPMEYMGTAKGMQGETRAGFHGTFTIDRMDYGIDWNPDVLGTEVWIALGVEGVKK